MRALVVLVALAALCLGARSELHHGHAATPRTRPTVACLTIITRCVNQDQTNSCPPCKGNR